MYRAACLAALLTLSASALEAVDDGVSHHHRHHHHHRHGHHHEAAVPARQALVAVGGSSPPPQEISGDQFAGNQLQKKVQTIDKEIKAEEQVEASDVQGQLLLNGPLPADFNTRFATAVSAAVGCLPGEVFVLHSTQQQGQPNVQELTYKAPANVVDAVDSQAADPNSKLAKGALHSFLVAQSTDEPQEPFQCRCQRGAPPPPPCAPVTCPPPKVIAVGPDEEKVPPPKGPYMDVDIEMPYGNLEPFGREDTAQELTESSMKESDAMVDQLEKAEVAEEKRAVFRALTRLRGAAIASFDGIAHAQTGNIDEYAKVNKWREAHPVHHLASEEADVYKWAFPDKSD